MLIICRSNKPNPGGKFQDQFGGHPRSPQQDPGQQQGAPMLIPCREQEAQPAGTFKLRMNDGIDARVVCIWRSRRATDGRRQQQGALMLIPCWSKNPNPRGKLELRMAQQAKHEEMV